MHCYSSGLNALSAQMQMMSTLMNSVSALQLNIGRTVIQTAIRPVASAAESHAISAGLAGLFYITAVNYCKNTDSCKPQIPILFYGSIHGELTQHIVDAQLGKGASALLHRMPTGGWGRNWFRSKDECDKDARAEFNQTMDCDEYPFNTSEEGGPKNYPARVSLRLINPAQNQDGGRLLGGMYKSDSVGTGDKYLVLAHPGLPLSFYLTRKGKFNQTRGSIPEYD